MASKFQEDEWVKSIHDSRIKLGYSGTYYLMHPTIPILDWDIKDGAKLSEIKRKLEDTGLVWNLYLTYAGFRAICLNAAESFNPDSMFNLCCDIAYVECVKKTGLYSARISPKKDRLEDKPICRRPLRVGFRDENYLPSNLLFIGLHDALCTSSPSDSHRFLMELINDRT